MVKKILIGLLIVLVVIQFIRPTRNTSAEMAQTDVSLHFTVPDNVKQILDRACYDCHSNNTRYPWYANVQPVGWWLQHHVNEGKEELNFSAFGSYTARRQDHKLEETVEQIKKGEMPLNSYLWIHTEAKLSDADKQTLINWADGLRKEIRANNNITTPEHE